MISCDCWEIMRTQSGSKTKCTALIYSNLEDRPTETDYMYWSIEGMMKNQYGCDKVLYAIAKQIRKCVVNCLFRAASTTFEEEKVAEPGSTGLDSFQTTKTADDPHLIIFNVS